MITKIGGSAIGISKMVVFHLLIDFEILEAQIVGTMNEYGLEDY